MDTKTGYRAHEPDLTADPHHWEPLVARPYDVLCGICGEIQTQNDDEMPVWRTVRKGVR